jgi:hypothetical protein
MTSKTQTKTKQTSKGTMSDKVKNPLQPGKIIYVKPIIRPNHMLPANHSGNWMYDNTGMSFTARLDINSGQIIEPLTVEERKFFEDPSRADEHGLDFQPGDLSAKKTKNNFWKNFKVKIVKKAKGPLSENNVLMKFDLGNPYDYFKYAVLKTWDGQGGKVAVGIDNKYSRATNRIVLVEKEEEHKTSINLINREEEANKFFYSINHSIDNMRDFLKAYNLTYRMHVDVPEDGSIDWFKVEVKKLINTELDKVLSLIREKDLYKDKVFMVRALKHGLVKIDRNKNYATPDGIPLGQDMEEAVKNLNKDENQDLLLQIKAKLDQ